MGIPSSFTPVSRRRMGLLLSRSCLIVLYVRQKNLHGPLAKMKEIFADFEREPKWYLDLGINGPEKIEREDWTMIVVRLSTLYAELLLMCLSSVRPLHGVDTKIARQWKSRRGVNKLVMRWKMKVNIIRRKRDR